MESWARDAMEMMNMEQWYNIREWILPTKTHWPNIHQTRVVDVVCREMKGGWWLLWLLYRGTADCAHTFNWHPEWYTVFWHDRTELTNELNLSISISFKIGNRLMRERSQKKSTENQIKWASEVTWLRLIYYWNTTTTLTFNYDSHCICPASGMCLPICVCVFSSRCHFASSAWLIGT